MIRCKASIFIAVGFPPAGEPLAGPIAEKRGRGCSILHPALRGSIHTYPHLGWPPNLPVPLLYARFLGEFNAMYVNSTDDAVPCAERSMDLEMSFPRDSVLSNRMFPLPSRG